MTTRRSIAVLLVVWLLCLCAPAAFAAEDEVGGIASLRSVSGAIEGTAVVRTVTVRRDGAVTVTAANGSEAERNNLSAIPDENCRTTLGSFSVAAGREDGLLVLAELSIPEELVGGYLNILHDAEVERSLQIGDGTMRVSVTGTGVYTLAVSDGRLMQRISPVTGQDALPFALGGLALLSAAGALLARRKIRLT